MSSRAAAAAAFTCASCSRSGPNVSALCARCQTTRYCNRDCQKTHWKVHKVQCLPTPAKQRPVTEADLAAQPTAAASATPADEPNNGPTIAEMVAEASASSSSSSSSRPSGVLNPITFSYPSVRSTSHPLLRVETLPGRGRGFIANETIQPGTLILTEQSIYAHSDGAGANEEQRIATLVGLTKVMLERYPESVTSLAAHADHELPEHTLIATPPEGVDQEKWHDALARVDSNQFTSNRGMMCAPTLAIFNHSCFPSADLIIREVPAEDDATRSVEQVNVYAIEPIEAGSEVTINYLGSDSLCRWYAPSMIRQESFQSQWQFKCTCIKCEGSKAKGIDKAIAYAPNGMDEALEKRYTDLVLAENTPQPLALLQLYRDMYKQFGGDQFFFHYLLHQVRTLLIFMPIAFDERQHQQQQQQSSKGGKSKSASSNTLTGEAEWLHMVEHHLQSLASNLLNPALHSIKSDTITVILNSSDFIGHEFAKLNAQKSGKDVVPHVELRKKIVNIANECDETYFDNPTFATLYPETHATMTKYAQ